MPGTLKVRPRYYRWHVDPGVEWVETNTNYGHLNWEIPLEQTAIVVVDVWERHYLADTEARANEIVQDKIVPLLSACREAGMPIIHAPAPGMAEKQENWVRLVSEDEMRGGPRAAWPPADFRAKKGAFAKYAQPFEPRDAEREAIRAKRRLHPLVPVVGDEPVIFNGEELHRYCEREGILFLFYIGFNTNACILLRDYGTIEMSKRGYEIVILRDCGTGMESFETHDTLDQTRGTILFLEMYGKYSLTSDELIAGLNG